MKILAAKQGVLAAAALLLGLSASSAAQDEAQEIAPANTLTYLIDGTASSVSVKVPFFAISSKTAHFPSMTGEVTIVPEDPSQARVDVTLDANTLTASDETTLRRLKGEKFFWVEEHPTVRFVGTRLEMTDELNGKFYGQLTARGFTRDEVLEVEFDRSPTEAMPGQIVGAKGKMVIDRRDYGMTSFAVIVGKKVTIRMTAQLVSQ